MRFLAGMLLALNMCATASAQDQELGPFSAFESIPAEIDAAAVFDNPAETLLLSPVGRTIRTLLATGNVFTQTERAWQALGRAFDAPVDDTIRALLSNRVVVVWDGFERGEHNMLGLTNSIDTRWALVCEVEPRYLREIRNAMRPVKREIVHGRPVYAIEQGRYRVVMLENSKPGEMATVLLAPSNGSELLSNVLAHLQDRRSTPAAATLITGHDEMLSTLAQEHANINNDQPTFAFMARTGVMLNTILPDAKPPVGNTPDAEPVFAAIVAIDHQSLACTFASDLRVSPDLRDAPVALLDAVGQDAVFALAASRAVRLSLTSNSMSIGFGLEPGTSGPEPQTDPQPEHGHANAEQAAEDIFDAPMLLTIVPLDPTDHAPTHTPYETRPAMQRMGICVTIENPRRDNGQSALLLDQSIQSVIETYDPQQAPDFLGRFPEIPRSVSLHSTTQSEEVSKQAMVTPGWLEHNPEIAWLSSASTDHDRIIASIGPEHTDPTHRVLQVQQAARTLDALGAQQPSGVLLRARMQPAKTLELFNESTLVDLVLAKLVREFNIDVRRGLRTGFRGSFELEFANPTTKPGLGAK